MPLQLHRIKEHPTDPNDLRIRDTVEDKVPRLPHYAAFTNWSMTSSWQLVSATVRVGIAWQCLEKHCF